MYKATHEQSSNKCFVFILATFVLLCAIILGFASIVLRVRRPLLQLESVSVNHLSYTTSPSPSPSFNLTMVAQISIKNPNLGRFDYGNSTVSVIYEGSIVGDRELQGGRVKGRENRAMNVTLNLRSEKVLSSGNLSSDIHYGAFNLTAYTKLTGNVHLLKFLNKKKSTEMACLMLLSLASNSVKNLRC